MLVVTRSNLAQSFKPTVGKNGKVSAAAKRLAATLNSVDTAQAVSMALRGSKAIRDVVLNQMENFTLSGLCAKPVPHFGNIFAEYSRLLGFPISPVEGEKAFSQLERLSDFEAASIESARIVGDSEGYTKNQIKTLNERQDNHDMVCLTVEQHNAALRARALSTTPVLETA